MCNLFLTSGMANSAVPAESADAQCCAQSTVPNVLAAVSDGTAEIDRACLAAGRADRLWPVSFLDLARCHRRNLGAGRVACDCELAVHAPGVDDLGHCRARYCRRLRIPDASGDRAGGKLLRRRYRG